MLPTPADNAAVVPRGLIRFSLATVWDKYDSRSGFSPATEQFVEPLGALYSSASVGITMIPSLSPVESAIGTLTGGGFTLSLGSSNLRAEVLKTVTPFSMDVGLTSWLSIGATIPLVRGTGETVLDFNAPGNSANVGLNPALQFVGPRAVNLASRNELTAAAGTLEQRLATCNSMPGDPGCAALLARAAEAQTLITQSRQFRDAMESVFGSDTVSAKAVVPLDGSAAQLAINARMAGFNTLFRDLLALDPTAPDPLVARPFPAQIALTATQFRSFLEAPEFGISMVPLVGFQRQGVGDIEVRARLRLFDSFRPREDGSPGARASLTVTGRLATGLPGTPGVPFDFGTGDGQNDVEVAGAADIRLSRGLALSVEGRVGSQLADQKPLRIAAPETPFAEAFTLRDVNRDLGDYFDFSVRPRLNLGLYATLTGAYYSFSKQADRHTGSFIASPAETGRGEITLDASVLDAGTEVSVQRAGLGIRIANYFDQAEKAVRTPLEFSFMYMDLLSSTGYGVPDASTMILQLRVHTRLFGR